jgi:capsular exopolysaccharide synthesis family protein
MQLRPILNYLLAIMLGLIVPAGVIFGLNSFEVKVNSIKEVERKLRYPMIGTIGQNRLAAPLVVFTEPNSAIAEAFRALRTDIHFLFPKDKAVTIMLTSTISGEGKTFCSANLASVYAKNGKKTILIGCDLHKPYKIQDFKITNTLGLSNFLSVQVDEIKPLIQRTKYDNLDILVPGPIPPNPAELLISDRFEQMILELKKSYDVIVLDTSPVGLTNESFYLTRIADLTIYLLRQNYSNKNFIGFINSFKEKKGLKNIYVVTNDVSAEDLSHGGYGYGYYSEDQRKKFSIRGLFKRKKSVEEVTLST